jgi:hypothetical protein
MLRVEARPLGDSRPLRSAKDGMVWGKHVWDTIEVMLYSLRICTYDCKVVDSISIYTGYVYLSNSAAADL